METLETEIKPLGEDKTRHPIPHGTVRIAHEVFATTRHTTYNSREVLGIFWKEEDAKKLVSDTPRRCTMGKIHLVYLTNTGWHRYYVRPLHVK